MQSGESGSTPNHVITGIRILFPVGRIPTYSALLKLDFLKCPSSCLFSTRGLTHSTPNFMRSTCGKSSLKSFSFHKKSNSSLSLVSQATVEYVRLKLKI